MLFTANKMSKLGEQFNRFYRLAILKYKPIKSIKNDIINNSINIKNNYFQEPISVIKLLIKIFLKYSNFISTRRDKWTFFILRKVKADILSTLHPFIDRYPRPMYTCYRGQYFWVSTLTSMTMTGGHRPRVPIYEELLRIPAFTLRWNNDITRQLQNLIIPILIILYGIYQGAFQNWMQFA